MTDVDNEVAEDRRAQILRVSAELFAELGYASTTVRSIAERTGLLSGSLYHHFDSKESILEEILHEFVFDLVARVEGIVAESGEDPQLALRRLISATTLTIGEHRAAILLLQNELATKLRDVPRFAPIVQQADVIRQAWVGILKAGTATGAFSPTLDPELIYRFARDTIWVVARWYQPGGQHSLEHIADEYATIIFNGISRQ